MKRMTVAQLAAAQGTDERDLVRALKALTRRKLVPGYYKSGKWIGSRPILTDKQAADLLGLEQAEVEAQLKPPPQWEQKDVLNGLFAFYKQHERWPVHKDWRYANGLPSMWTLTRLANPSHFRWWRWPQHTNRQTVDPWRRPWDHYQRLIANDKRCTARMAFGLRNVLARKEAIDRIGFDKLIKNLGDDAQVLDEHPEFGILYSLPGETVQERMLLVKVVNSTPEPDGTFADYYLRVPPTFTSVQEALAWTFDLNEETKYQPLIET